MDYTVLDEELKARRLPKSKRHIIVAFMQMREQSELEKITVVELCSKADINKSTFYKYYHDVYDLSDRLQTELIQKFIASMDDPNEIMTDPGTFTKNILSACRPDHEIVRILFSGSQFYKLPMKMDETIKQWFYKIRPWHIGDMHHAVMLSYKIYGSFFAYIMNPDFDSDETIDYIGDLSGSFATHDV